MKRVFTIVALSGAFLTAAAATDLGANPDAPFRFLDGSIWYVPVETLPAAAMDLTNGKVLPLVDQTVWEIAGYRDGYFWGRSIASFTIPGIATPQVECSRMLGSVTPDGRVLISFVADNQQNASGAVSGIGTLFRHSPRGWRFQMQMATGATSITAHWSFMDQCRKNEPCASKLPGSKLSLRQFLAQCG